MNNTRYSNKGLFNSIQNLLNTIKYLKMIQPRSLETWDGSSKFWHMKTKYCIDLAMPPTYDVKQLPVYYTLIKIPILIGTIPFYR